MEEKEFYEGYPSMIRLTYKAKLISDCTDVYKILAQFKQVTPRAFRKKAEKNITRDFMRGIKVINKNNPVYAEMPKIKSVGNGVTQKIDPKTKEPINNELEVHERLENLNSGYIDYTEE